MMDFFESRAAACLAVIPAVVMCFGVASFAMPGDGGGALYIRAEEPATPQLWHFPSADGSWWQLDNSGEIKPEMLGAKGDDVTDDGPAVNAALLHGKRVFLSSRYRSNETVRVGAGGFAQRLYGDKLGRITCTATNAPAVALMSGIPGCIIQDFQIGRVGPAGVAGHGLVIDGGGYSPNPPPGMFNVPGSTNDAIIRGMALVGHADGIRLGTTDFSVCEDNLITGCWGDAIYGTTAVGYGIAQWHIRNNLATRNAGAGYRFQATAGSPGAILGEWFKNSTYANGDGGIKILGRPDCGINDVRIHLGFIGGDNGHEIYLDTYGSNHVIQGVFVEYSGASGCGPGLSIPASNSGGGIVVTANNNVVGILDNKVYLCADHGISCAAMNAQVSGNVCHSNGRAGNSSLRCGIFMAGGNGNVSDNVSGNLAGGGYQSYGLVVSADAFNLKDNDLDLGNSIAPFWGPPMANSIVRGNTPASMNLS